MHQALSMNYQRYPIETIFQSLLNTIQTTQSTTLTLPIAIGRYANVSVVFWLQLLESIAPQWLAAKQIVWNHVG